MWLHSYSLEYRPRGNLSPDGGVISRPLLFEAFLVFAALLIAQTIDYFVVTLRF
jgi:hypothetical protein